MSRELSLTLDGTTYKVILDGNSVVVNGRPFVVGLETGQDKVVVDGVPYTVQVEGEKAVVNGIAHSLQVAGLGEEKAGPRAAAVASAGEGAVTAIMPGKIIRVLVGEGDHVDDGQVICILEAMKMENELKAPRAGVVKALYVQAGQDVEMGSVLAEIE